MAFLYPRLLAQQARPLFDEYRHLELPELMRVVDYSHTSAVYVATGGDRVSPDRLRALREDVLVLARGAGFPDESNRALNTEFDLRLAALLHSEMGMVPAEAASRDVWAFLALILLPDVAFWRYPQPPKDRILGTDLTRHVFGRLWWRAQLVRSQEAPEPYAALEILGEAAFDQIYARRTALGGSPHMVRAILRVWNDLDLNGLNERETLRDFLKRLLRLAPFMLFDGVEEHALDLELRVAAQESVDAQRLSLSSTEAHALPAEPAAPRSPRTSEATTASSAHENVTVSTPLATAVAPGRFRSVEVCAGGGAQALGLEQAGFDPVLLIDSHADACFTIDRNRPEWEVICMDVAQFHPNMRPETLEVDLISAGLPRFRSATSVGRSQDTEFQVLQAMIGLTQAIRPKALLLENIPDLAESTSFENIRSWIRTQLTDAGYHLGWNVLNAVDFGVPQNRRSGFLVAMLEPYFFRFSWPPSSGCLAPTVGQVLGESMATLGWPGAERWAKGADRVAPALVGGSDRRGGADLGPAGSKKAWAALGVNGSSLGDAPPDVDFPADEHPRLTVEQAAALQSIPKSWTFFGGKTSRYRQIGHATPPPLAAAVGLAIANALRS